MPVRIWAQGQGSGSVGSLYCPPQYAPPNNLANFSTYNGVYFVWTGPGNYGGTYTAWFHYLGWDYDSYGYIRYWYDYDYREPMAGHLALQGWFLPATPTGFDALVNNNVTTFTPNQQLTVALGANGIVRVAPNKSYTISVTTNGLVSGALNVAAPPQYKVLLNGIERSRCGLTNQVTLTLVPRNEVPAGAAGFASSLSADRIDWRLPLGTLRNGDDAGALRLIEPGVGSDWNNVFAPAALNYEATSDEIYVHRMGNAIKQIIANQVAIDIEVPANTTNLYKVHCYNPSQIVTAGPPATFTGQPFATYTVRQSDDAGDPATALKIIREFRNDANGSVVRTETTKLVRTGTFPNFTWTKVDWHSGGTPLQETIATIASSGNTRTEVLALRKPGTPPTVALSATRVFNSYNFGEAMGSETVGTTQPRTVGFNYYSDLSQPGSLGFLESIRLPGGGWEAYDYYDSNQAASYQGGRIKYRYKPFGSFGSDTPSHNTAHGEVTYYEYGPDPFGANSRLTLARTTTNGVETGKTTIAYNSTATDGYIIATQTQYANAGTPLTTTTEYYSEAWSDSFVRGKIRSVRSPDGVTSLYTYEKGTWDGTTFDPNGTPVNASRISVEKVQDGGTPLHRVSTKEVTIRDSRALIARTETYVYDGGAWQLVGWTGFGYNFAGLLVSRYSSTNQIYTAVRNGNLKTSEAENGIETAYTYDAAARVLTATQSSTTAAGTTIPALTTNYSYDAANRVLEQRVGPTTGESLLTTAAYDDVGRLISETKPGYGATTHAYNVSARTRTTTRPDGSTVIEARNLDGSVASRTGTGIVHEYVSVGIETDGRRWSRVDFATRNSPRWTKTTIDWLGRKLSTQKPGFGGSGILEETNVFDANTTGRLVKTTATGVAPTLFSYNALSQLVQSGMDVDNSGVLVTASTDRVTDSDELYEYVSGAWWLTKTESTYPYEGGPAGTAVQVSKTSKRLTGYYTSGYTQLRDEIRTWDIFGNETRRTVTLDYATQLTTITTARMNGSTAVLTEVEKLLNGLPISHKSFAGITKTTAYDNLWRPVAVTDPRTGATATTYHSGTRLVDEVKDPSLKRLAKNVYDTSGRVIYSESAHPTSTTSAGYTTRTAYTSRGEVSQVWGSGTYPVSYEYNEYGERTKMRTYRDPDNVAVTDSTSFPNLGNGDETTWEFDAATGLLKKKYDAKAKFVEYDYDAAGRLWHRYWARTLPSSSTRVTTTYAYNSATGEQMSISYNDGTPGLAYGYNRLGQNTSVVQSYSGSSIQTLLDYCLCGKLSTETFDGTFFGGRVLTHFQNPNADGLKGRTTGYGLNVGATVEQSTTYAYESATGRFNALGTQAVGSSAYSHTFTYGYLANSDMIGSLAVDSGHPFTITRSFESTRDVLTSIETKWSTTRRVKYAYTYDNRRQRATMEQSGDVFADYGGSGDALGAIHQLFAYNGRGEVIDAASYVGPLSGGQSSANFMSARRHEFSYDGIGNRRTSNTSGVLGTQDNYVVNELNQYVARENNTLAVGGTVANDSAIKVVAGANAVTLAGRHGRHWGDNMLLDNLNGPYLGPVKLFTAKVGGGSGGADLLKVLDRTAFIPPAWQQMTYDDDGNILDDGVWTYTWDAENRLIAMQTKTAAIGAGIPSAEARRLEFKYDYLGRRIEKTVRRGWNGTTFSATPTSHHRFIYNNWNLIAEYAVSGSTLTVTRTYTWGLDIVHDLAKSGGVGALVQIADHALGKAYFPAYDGNGNIAALFDGAASGGTAGSCVAAYEYSPFGEFLRCEGTYAKGNPFRFSTKFTDDETGLVYYGRRYYSPAQGRFLGRDPAKERGGLNLYGFVTNNPINLWDYLGMGPPDGDPAWRLVSTQDDGSEVWERPDPANESVEKVVVMPKVKVNESNVPPPPAVPPISVALPPIGPISVGGVSPPPPDLTDLSRSVRCTLRKNAPAFNAFAASKLTNDATLGQLFRSADFYQVAMPSRPDMMAGHLPGPSGPMILINTASNGAPSSYSGSSDQWLTLSVAHELFHAQHAASPTGLQTYAASLGLTGPLTAREEDAIARMQADNWATANGVACYYCTTNINDIINHADLAGYSATDAWRGAPTQSSAQVNASLAQAGTNVGQLRLMNQGDCPD